MLPTTTIVMLAERPIWPTTRTTTTTMMKRWLAQLLRLRKFDCSHSDLENQLADCVKSTSASRPRGRPAGSSFVLRAPTAAGRYYSTTANNFNSKRLLWLSILRLMLISMCIDLGRDGQHRLTHVGRIEEDLTSSVLRTPACARCAARGWACRVYTAAAVQQYQGRQTMNKCGRCRYDGQQCD